MPRVFAIARDVGRRIRLNLAFAFSFNTVGILLAAAGRLTPIVAAAAMILSSLAVVRISAGAAGPAGEHLRDLGHGLEGHSSDGRAGGEHVDFVPTGPRTAKATP